METNTSKRIEIKSQDNERIKSLQQSIEKGEYANNSMFGDCRTELFNFGWTYAAMLRDEFDENTDNKIKFENDYKVEVESQPNIKLSYFKDSEIERIKDLKDLIVKCFGNSRVYRTFNQYILMCNYLEFLQQYKTLPDNTKTTPPPKTNIQPLTFKELFKELYSEHIDSLLEQLNITGLTETNNSWREWETCLVEKNETSKLYFYLKRKNVLNDYDKTKALICFNEKFGIEVYRDKETPKSNRCVSIRTLVNSENTATKTKLKDKFDIAFNKWTDKMELK